MGEVLLLILAVAFFARRGRGGRSAPDRWATILRDVEARGIISPEQRAAILAHAAEIAEREPRLAGAAWLGVFAGLFVVAGVSLLIARNWDDIGPAVRIGGFLVLLAGVGEAAIRLRGRALAASLPVEILWFFLPLLGIGLYAQTFQLSGDPIRPFLVWLALGLPLAWLSDRPIVAMLHTFALAVVLFVGNYVVEPAAVLTGAGTATVPGMLALTDHGGGGGAWVLSVVLLVVIAVQCLRLLPRHHRHHFVGICVAWLFCLLVASTPFRLRHEAWLVLGGLGLVTLWVVIVAALDASFEERAAGVGAWLATIYGLTFTWHMDRAASGSTTAPGLIVAGGAATGAVVVAFALSNRRLSPDAAWAFAMKAALVAPLLAAVLLLSNDVRLVWTMAAVMNVLLVAIAVGLMWHGSLVHEAAQVNLGVLVLIAVLVTRFLDVFGSMLRSGIGFIVAGVLLAGLSWALERTRRRLLGASPGGGTA